MTCPDPGPAGLSRRGLLTTAAVLAAMSWAVPAAARTYTIIVEKMKFGPAPAGLRVGDTVSWVNRDPFRHSATARNGAFDVDLPPGGTGTAVMATTGAFPYACRFHSAMTGELIVTA